MSLTNAQISSYEADFGRMEELALAQKASSLKLKLVDQKESARLMADAASLANDAAAGRAELKRQVIAYTPEETPAGQIVSDLYTANKGVTDEAQSNFQETNQGLAEKGSFVSVPTVPLARVGTEKSYVGTKAWGPDEFLVKQVGHTVVPAIDGLIRNFAKATGQAVSNAMPDEAETYMVEAIKGAHYDVSRQDWYQKVSGWLENGLVEPYMAWKKKNPKRAELAESVISTTGMVLDRTNISSMARRSGTRIALSGAQGAKLKRRAFVQDLLTPMKPDSANNPASWTSNASGDPLFVPSVREQAAIHETTLIPNLDPSAPAPTSRKHINDQLAKLSMRLEEVILKNGNPRYSQEHLNAVIGGHVDDLLESTEFRAASGGTSGVPALLEHMGTMVGKSNNDALGLLELRREFDDWIENKVKLSDLEPQARTSLERVIENVRTTLNSELDQIVPDAPTKRLRSRVSALYTARDMIAKKADDVTGGLVAAINKGLYNSPLRGVRMPTTAGGTTATVALGSTIVGATYGVPILSALGGTYGSYKGVMALTNPTLRRKVGNAIVFISKRISAIKDPLEIAMLRSDRAVLLQAMSDSVVTKEEEK